MGRAGRLKAQVAPKSEPDESMNSRVSWSVEGIDPSVRERAEAAARRAGMSLNDWLNSTVGDSAPPDFRAAVRPPAMRRVRTHATSPTFTSGSNSITRQIEQISRPAPRNDAPRSEHGDVSPGS